VLSSPHVTGRLSGLWVAAVALGAPFAGCSRPPAPGGPPAAEAAGTPRPAHPPDPTGPALPAKVLDFQLFHPYSSLREASLPQDEARAARIGLPGEYGVAVLVEAVNESGALLEPPVLDGDFALELEGGGAVRCTLQKWNGVWSHDPGGRSPWRQEGGVEAFWRPAERVRMLATATCGEPWLADSGLSAFRVQLAIRARVAGREKEASSGRLELGLPAAAGVAQLLVLPGGVRAAASADLVVRDDRFRAGVEPLRSVAGRADQVQREPVPGAVPVVRGRAGPVAYRADGIALAHWTDAGGVPKGSRRLAVTWTLAADPSTGVAERERAAGAAARLQRARQALGAARELAQGASGDPGRPRPPRRARGSARPRPRSGRRGPSGTGPMRKWPGCAGPSRPPSRATGSSSSPTGA
jgi:hypothetical protein